jgi:TPR repeat protein
MKKRYLLPLLQGACFMLLSLLLQNCGGLGNLPIERDKTDLLQTNTQAILLPANIQPLTGQVLTAEGGHAVTLYEEAGELRANVEMNAPEGFSKSYEGVEVLLEQGAEVSDLPRLGEQAQQRRIHLQLAQGKQPAKVIIYKGAGLVGGMLVGEEEASDSDNQEPIQARHKKLVNNRELRKYFNKGNLEITPNNYKILLNYADKYASAFQSYDCGLLINNWNDLTDFSNLTDLLLAFTSIRAFTIDCSQAEETEVAEIIGKALQFYEDLMELDISGCKLNQKLLIDVLASIVYPKRIKKLNISNNQVSAAILSELQAKFANAQIIVDLAENSVNTASSLPPQSEVEASDDLEFKYAKQLSTSLLYNTTPIVPEASEEHYPTLKKKSRLKKAGEIGGGTVAIVAGILTWPLGPMIVDMVSAIAGDAGDIEKKNTKIFNKLTKKAQFEDEILSQYELGQCYEKGFGTSRDDKQAFMWYKVAAERGFRNAQFRLGYLYHYGFGVVQDYVQAKMWYEKAIEKKKIWLPYRHIIEHELQNLNYATNRLQQPEQSELQIDSITTDKVDNVKKKNIKKFNKLTRGAQFEDKVVSQYELGQCYEKGWETAQDYKQAFAWYKVAAEKGNTNAQYKLGYLYHYGYGIEQDCVQAKEWYQMALGKRDWLEPRWSYIIEHELEKIKRITGRIQQGEE